VKDDPGSGKDFIGPKQDSNNNLPELAEALLKSLKGTFARPLRNDTSKSTYSYFESKYKTLVEQIPAVTFSASFDQGLKEVYVSPYIENLLGYTQKEWLENPILWYSRLHTKDKSRWNRDFAKTIVTGEPFSADYRFVAKNDRVVWLHGEARVVFDNINQPRYIQGVGFDITEIKQAEEKTRAAHENLQRVLSSASDIISTGTLEGIIVTLNPAFEKITGHKMENWIGKSYTRLVHSDNLESVGSAIQDIATGSIQTTSIELKLKTQEEGWVDLEFAIQGITDSSGRTRGLLAIGRDISAKKELERQKQNEQERLKALVDEKTAEISRYRDIVESSTDAIVTIELDGTISSWNHQAEVVFGYQADEAIGQQISILTPDSDPLGLTLFEQMNQTKGGFSHVVVKRRAKNGAEIDVSVSAFPVRGHNGIVTNISEIIRDISEQKKADQKFKLAVEAAPNSMIMTDANGRIVLSNFETERIFGYKREELLYQPIEVLVPDKSRKTHPSFRRNYLSSPITRRMGEGRDLFGLAKNGTEIPVEIGLNPITTTDGIFVLCSIVDISERKSAEQEIRAKNELLEAQKKDLDHLNIELAKKNSDLEQFVYTVSHDLKSPLVTISGFAKLLGNEELIRSNIKLDNYVKRIIKNSTHMGMLLEDLLNLSRVSYRTIEFTEVDLFLTIERGCALLQEKIHKSHAQINIKKSTHKIMAQENLLSQVFSNLISNAIKYAKPNMVPEVQISFKEKGNNIEVVVHDNGLGIPRDQHEKVFKIFERFHPKIKEGTGVGLAIVKKIVERHGGSISFKSEENQGSTFSILLPLRNGHLRMRGNNAQ
jgi:PAS domain S-box-containing protein